MSMTVQPAFADSAISTNIQTVSLLRVHGLQN